MIQENKIQVVTPEQFPCLPKTMYAYGNIELLNKKSLAVAGARKANISSKNWVKQAIADLPKDWVVTSGLALGTDAIAHQSAIENNIKTIAVLPSGINNITPKTNIPIAKNIISHDGLLLSEYPAKQGIKSNKQYIDRNKIIIDISNSLLVPEFEIKSGTRHTVDFAQKQNKIIIIKDDSFSGNQYIISNKNYRTFIR